MNTAPAGLHMCSHVVHTVMEQVSHREAAAPASHREELPGSLQPLQFRREILVQTGQWWLEARTARPAPRFSVCRGSPGAEAGSTGVWASSLCVAMWVRSPFLPPGACALSGCVCSRYVGVCGTAMTPASLCAPLEPSSNKAVGPSQVGLEDP